MIRLGIVGKIWLGLGLMSAGFLVVIGMGWLSSFRLTRHLSHVETRHFPDVVSAAAALNYFKRMQDQYKRAILLGEPELVDLAHADMEQACGALAKLSLLDPVGHSINRGDRLCRRIKDFSDDVEPLYRRLSQGDLSLDHKLMAGYAAESRSLQAELEALHNELETVFRAEIRLVSDTMVDQQRVNIAVFLVISLVSGTSVYLMITRKVRLPIEHAVSAARQIAGGDYRQRLVETGDDEIGEFSVAFNCMAENLQSTLDGLQFEIRERRRAEDEVRQLNSGLEERVERRTLELCQANDDLEETIEKLRSAQNMLVESEKMAALGQLVAGIAHEINTPVGVGVTAATHLRDETVRVLSLTKEGQLKKSDFDSYLSAMGEGTSILTANLFRAANLIRSFKQVAVDQSHESKRRFRLGEYLDEIVASLSPKFSNTNHRIQVDCPPDLELVSYPGALAQILTNLVTNSLIHGFAERKDGRIKITVEQTESIFRLTYRDNGCGFDPAVGDRLYEPFYTTRRKEGGTGLGMHIVYNLTTQKLGGTIRYEQPADGGLAFILEFSSLEEFVERAT